jgi:hypothetical protein
MPAIGDLDCVRKRPLRRDCVATATVPGDDADLWALSRELNLVG